MLIVRGGVRDGSRYNYHLHDGFFAKAFQQLGYRVVHYGRVAQRTTDGPFPVSVPLPEVVRQVRPVCCLGIELDRPLYLQEVRGVPRIAYVCDVHRLNTVDMLAGVDLLLVRALRFVDWVRKLHGGSNIGRVEWLPFSYDQQLVDSIPDPRRRARNVIFLGGFRREPWPARRDAMFLLNRAGLLSERSAKRVGYRLYGRQYFETLKSSILGLTCTTRWRLNPAKHFEIPACGTVLMTDGAQGMDQILPADLYVKYQPPTVVDTVRRALADDHRLRQMAVDSRAYMRTHHTDAIRAKELREILGSMGIG